MIQNKKSNTAVTRNEFLKETKSIREEINLMRKEMATKGDFNKLATEIVKTQADLRELKDYIEIKISTESSKILNAIDAFAQKAENYDRKALFHGSCINDHEERITQLEKTPSI